MPPQYGPPAGSYLDFRNLLPPVFGLALDMPTEDKVDGEASGRRRWRRYHVTVPVRVTIQKLLHVGVFNSLSFQMNEGGLELLSDDALRIGDKADLEFKPPHFDRALMLRGVVRNYKGNLYGVEFLAKGGREKEQLGLFRQILARWGAGA